MGDWLIAACDKLLTGLSTEPGTQGERMITCCSQPTKSDHMIECEDPNNNNYAKQYSSWNMSTCIGLGNESPVIYKVLRVNFRRTALSTWKFTPESIFVSGAPSATPRVPRWRQKRELTRASFTTLNPDSESSSSPDLVSKYGLQYCTKY